MVIVESYVLALIETIYTSDLICNDELIQWKLPSCYYHPDKLSPLRTLIHWGLLTSYDHKISIIIGLCYGLLLYMALLSLSLSLSIVSVNDLAPAVWQAISVKLCCAISVDQHLRKKENFFCYLIYIYVKKYIVCDACGLKYPSFESSGVLYITPTYTSFTQQLIMQAVQQKLEKSCFRCKENTWRVESNYILQPPKYLIIIVNRFRYINNNVPKIGLPYLWIWPLCLVSINPACRLPQIIMDHLSILVIILHLSTVAKTFCWNDSKITEYKMIDTKLTYCICYII